MPRHALGPLTLATVLLATPAARAVDPDQAKAAPKAESWVLESTNWQDGKDVLPEPVVKHLQAGDYWFNVVSVDPNRFHHNYSQAFWDATDKNAGKYDLDAKACGLKDKATGKIRTSSSACRSRRSTRPISRPAARSRGTSPWRARWAAAVVRPSP